MAVSTDLWELILDIKARFDSLGMDRQFMILSLASLFCSFVYGYLLDGWLNDELLNANNPRGPQMIAQSENLFALMAAIVHALCAAFERILRNAFRTSSSLEDDSVSNSSYKTVFARTASLRSYMLYSTLESFGILCLNWSLLYVDKHVCAIFKSNKIIVILIGEVFFLKSKEDISGFQVASILGVAVSMMLLSLSELDELYHFDLSGIPIILVGVMASASAPILAKQYIFSKYAPNRTEVLFFHKFFTSMFLFVGVAPQFVQLFFYENWFNEHLLGFVEMLLLSIVSYGSLSLMMIIIDVFGPTNSELVECTSLITSVIFSYYFMEAGSEFVWQQMFAMLFFIVSFALSVRDLSEKRLQSEKQQKQQEIRLLSQNFTKIIQNQSGNIKTTADIKHREADKINVDKNDITISTQ